MTRRAHTEVLTHDFDVPPGGTVHFVWTPRMRGGGDEAPDGIFLVRDVRVREEYDGEIQYVQIGNIVVARWALVPGCPSGVNVTVHVLNRSMWATRFSVKVEGDYYEAPF